MCPERRRKQRVISEGDVLLPMVRILHNICPAGSSVVSISPDAWQDAWTHLRADSTVRDNATGTRASELSGLQVQLHRSDIAFD